MPALIQEIEQLTPAYLTGVLRQRGCLPDGHVKNVSVREKSHTPWSLIYRLAVSYSEEAPACAPEQLFLKTGRGGEREVLFYNVMANTIGALPVPPCYEAVYSTEADRSHLLLQDLSETHGPVAPWPMPPLFGQGQAIVESLAKLHAYWWEAPDLRQRFGPLPDARGHAGYVDWARGNVQVFTDFLGDRFLADHRDLYDRVLAFLPGLWESYWGERFDSLKGLTLIHGDAHPGNLLYPHDPARHPLYMVDWQAYHTGAGAQDVAYMFTCHWYPYRKDVIPFLKHYHTALQALGVGDYPWESFWLDYRIAVIDYLLDAPRLCAAGVTPEVWWPIYQRGLVAFTNLGCDQLLDE